MAVDGGRSFLRLSSESITCFGRQGPVCSSSIKVTSRLPIVGGCYPNHRTTAVIFPLPARGWGFPSRVSPTPTLQT